MAFSQEIQKTVRDYFVNTLNTRNIQKMPDERVLSQLLLECEDYDPAVEVFLNDLGDEVLNVRRIKTFSEADMLMGKGKFVILFPEAVYSTEEVPTEDVLDLISQKEPLVEIRPFCSRCLFEEESGEVCDNPECVNHPRSEVEELIFHFDQIGDPDVFYPEDGEEED